MLGSAVQIRPCPPSNVAKRVVYNGVKMVEGWPERIQEAQGILHYSIDGVERPRIRYGDEADNRRADSKPCHDCAVIKGQLHVVGCDAEQCPACRGQAIGCECCHDDDHGV